MKQIMLKEVKQALKKKHACYVLITCSAPNEEGEMEVEMDCEGDPVLASYLIRGAQCKIDDKLEKLEENSESSNNKLHFL